MSVTVGVESFLEVAICLGKEFLSCGGPVTRVEGELTLAGNRLGYDVSVNATPSSLSVSCTERHTRKTFSRVCRIEQFTINLGRLCYTDKLLRNLAEGKGSATQILVRLQRFLRNQSGVSLPRHFSCLFGIGMAAGLLSNAPIFYALLGGAFTVAIDFIVWGLNRYFGLLQIFNDFIACFLVFFLATLAAHYLKIPPTVLTIGTLAFIVPGLLMTTAISEVVDQNYVSGSIRLLKTCYTFLAMALAYYLAGDLVSTLGLNMQSELSRLKWVEGNSILWKMIATVTITLCFSIEFGAYIKSLPRILFCGLSGSVAFFALANSSYVVLSSFVAAYVIGVFSFWLSRRYGHPSQIYSVPSILSLVPGMLAFSSFGYGRESSLQSEFAMQFAVQAMLISLAIVFGLAAGRIRFF